MVMMHRRSESASRHKRHAMGRSRRATEYTLLEKKTERFHDIVLIDREDEDLWTQMGQLRAKTYVDKHHFLPEQVVDENGCEFDEYDSSDATLHIGAMNQEGRLIGTVRVIGRSSAVNEGRLPCELAYEMDLEKNAAELSRLIVDKDLIKSSLEDSVVASLGVLRSSVHHMRAMSEDIKMYAMIDNHLVSYLNGIVGVGMTELAGSRRLNEYDTVDTLVEMEPRYIASQIAEYEKHNSRSMGIIERVATFTEDAKATRGLGRISLDTVYRSNDRYDRNLGWVSAAEQDALRSSTVAIAGVGGDGGALAVTLARKGVGRFHLADPEVFEVENTNRQQGASYFTIGRNKAEVIAEEIMAINPNAIIDIYPEGINEQNVDSFVSGSDLVVDETEYTHQELAVIVARAAREHNLPVLTTLNVGFGAYVTSYVPTGKPFEHQLGLSKDTPIEKIKGTQAKIANWIPHIPSYADMRLFKQVANGDRSTPTVAEGVQLAAGIAATQAFAHLVSSISPERKKWIHVYPRGVSIDAIDGSREIRYPKLSFYTSAGRAALRTILRRNPKTA